jgi:predicted N-acyltransferase
VWSVRRLARISEVSAAEWDALVGDDDPFVEHAFLDGLEKSGSVGRRAGWTPMHLVVMRGGELVGALPLYAKEDSWGEFIFDFQWARAAAASRIRYYPKLVSMAPFTPATGRRFLVREDAERAEVVTRLLDGARALATELGASSVHLLYLNEVERAEVRAHGGYAERLSLQFHWHNAGYRDFAHYLEAFRSPARKQVRRERRAIAESDVEVRVIDGPALGDADWKALEIFYRMNVARHGSFAYLEPGFFAHLRAHHAHRVLACLAYRDGEPIGGSLNFEKGRHLYGRYWGSTEDLEMLHFECCYYRLIERAIERGHTRFEAGAQGHHKLKRGLLPAEIHSAHWIADPRLAQAVGEFLPHERAHLEQEIALVMEESPFKRG